MAIAQAASSDKTTPSHCVASLLMLLDLAEATDAPVFGRLLKQLFEKNCPMARQKSLFILSRLPAAQVPQVCYFFYLFFFIALFLIYSQKLLDVLLPAALNPLPKLRTTDITLRYFFFFALKMTLLLLTSSFSQLTKDMPSESDPLPFLPSPSL